MTKAQIMTVGLLAWLVVGGTAAFILKVSPLTLCCLFMIVTILEKAAMAYFADTKAV